MHFTNIKWYSPPIRIKHILTRRSPQSHTDQGIKPTVCIKQYTHQLAYQNQSSRNTNTQHRQTLQQLGASTHTHVSWSPNSTVLHLDIYLCKYTNLKTQQGNLLHTCARLEHSTDHTPCVSHPWRLVAIDLNGDALLYKRASVQTYFQIYTYLNQNQI